jgi:hypothetical protein
MIETVTKKYQFNIHNGYIMIVNNISYSVPLDQANTDYQAIQKWIAEGGVVIDNPPTQENN